LDRPNCVGSENVTRDRRYAHLVSSMTPLEPRASCCVIATCTLGAPLARPSWKCHRLSPASGPRGCRRFPAQGPRRRSPSGSGSHRHRATDLGTAATTHPSQGATAIATTGQGSVAARALVQPPPSPAPGWASSLMNRDGA
jgi:hypothetical protein